MPVLGQYSASIVYVYVHPWAFVCASLGVCSASLLMCMCVPAFLHARLYSRFLCVLGHLCEGPWAFECVLCLLVYARPWAFLYVRPWAAGKADTSTGLPANRRVCACWGP